METCIPVNFVISGALKKHIKNDHNHNAQVLNLSVYFVMPIP